MSSAYYSKLINLIPSRKQFKSYAGSEGVAYFVSDKYVLKEYTKVEDWETFDRFFDLYCSEVQKFANSGMNIAKIIFIIGYNKQEIATYTECGK